MRRPRWLRREGPSFLQLHRARHISVVRAEERRKRAGALTARPPRLPGDGLVRLATVLAVVAVAGVAAYVSYWHAVAVVTRLGEHDTIGHLYPVAIDGIIVAASMVLLDAARNHEDAPPLAWVMLGAGIAVTLAANVAYGARSGAAGALWAAWPAAAFVGCYELLMLLVRASARRAGAMQDETPATHFAPGFPDVAHDALDAAIRAMIATVQAGNPHSARGLATRFELPQKIALNVRRLVLENMNGSAPQEAGGGQDGTG